MLHILQVYQEPLRGKKHMLAIETQVKEPNPTSFAGTARVLEALRLTGVS